MSPQGRLSLPLTTKTIIFAGSYSKALHGIYRQPTKKDGFGSQWQVRSRSAEVSLDVEARRPLLEEAGGPDSGLSSAPQPGLLLRNSI